MSDKPKLHEAGFLFSQEGNTNGSTSEFESITINFESSLGLDDENDGFFVLKTEGWSINGVDELEELFDRIRMVLKSKASRQ